MWSLGRGHLWLHLWYYLWTFGTGVKSAKSRLGLWVRNSDFSCCQCPSYWEFTSITCERRIFKFFFMILTIVGYLLSIVWPGGRYSQSSCVSTNLLRCRISTWAEAPETTWTGSERTGGIHPHCNSSEIPWASLPTPGSQGCFVITTCLTPSTIGSVPPLCLSSNQTSLYSFRLFSDLLQRGGWSWGRRREPLAAPGAEWGPWVRWCWIQCPGNIPSDFPMRLY